MRWFAVLFALGIFSAPGHGAPSDFAPLGRHYPFLRIEKNENPQNLMVVYTKLDSECRFVADPDRDGQPFFDFYWLMDGTRYKKVHPLILRAVRDRLQFLNEAADRSHFQLRFSDLKELRDPPRDNAIMVSARRGLGTGAGGDNCEVEARMGGSRLTRIYSESERTFWPPFHRLVAVTLTRDAGEQRYSARR